MTSPRGQEPLEKEENCSLPPEEFTQAGVRSQAHRCPSEPVFRPSGLAACAALQRAGSGMEGVAFMAWGWGVAGEDQADRNMERAAGEQACGGGCSRLRGASRAGMGWEAQFWVIAQKSCLPGAKGGEGAAP